MIMKIDAIVREEKFEDVKNALMEIEVNGLTVSQVMGCGLQRGYKEIVRGMEVEPQMQPKVKFEIVVSSEEWAEKTIEAIKKASGRPQAIMLSAIRHTWSAPKVLKVNRTMAGWMCTLSVMSSTSAPCSSAAMMGPGARWVMPGMALYRWVMWVAPASKALTAVS